MKVVVDIFFLFLYICNWSTLNRLIILIKHLIIILSYFKVISQIFFSHHTCSYIDSWHIVFFSLFLLINFLRDLDPVGNGE